MTEELKFFIIRKYKAVSHENGPGWSWVLMDDSEQYIYAGESTVKQILSLLNTKMKRVEYDKIDVELQPIQAEKRRLEEIKNAVDTLTETQRKLFQAFIDFDKMFDKAAFAEQDRKEKLLIEKRERIRSGDFSQKEIDQQYTYLYEEIFFKTGAEKLRELY